MNKIVPSILSLALVFSFVAPDAQAQRLEPTTATLKCSPPKKIHSKGDRDIAHTLVNFRGVERIYYLRDWYRRSVQSIELSPGLDREFGTSDDFERSIPSAVYGADHDSVWIDDTPDLYSLTQSDRLLVKPGLDNTLFTPDDEIVAKLPESAIRVNKNESLLAWQLEESGKVYACDLSIKNGRGSCIESINHWSFDSCVNNECVVEPGDISNVLFPSKQIINGVPVPMILGFYKSLRGNFPLQPRVTMLENGFSFPVTLPVDSSQSIMTDIRGSLLLGEDVSGTASKLYSINLDFNDPNFMQRTDITLGNHSLAGLENRTNNRSSLPAYTTQAVGTEVLYFDPSRGIKAVVEAPRGAFIYGGNPVGKKVLTYMSERTPNPRVYNQGIAVSICP